MRKLVLSLAAAGAALAVASPAAAQFYPQPQPYGYNGGYNNFGQVRALKARIDRLQWQIERFKDRSGLRNRDANRLRKEARRIEDRLDRAQRFGLNAYEANDIQMRITQLEQQLRYTAGNGYNGYNNGGYYNGGDRTNRDDRYDGRRRDRDDD
jgi:hypothetical protein